MPVPQPSAVPLPLAVAPLVPIVAGHDIIRFPGQSAFQNHLIVGIRSCTRCAVGGKNKQRRFRQHIRTFNGFPVGIAKTQFFNRLVVFGEHRRTDDRFTSALRPRGQTVKRLPAPEARAGDHIRAEDDPHFLRRLRTLPMARVTAVSSVEVISGNSRPARINERTREGVNALRLRMIIIPWA